MGGPPGGGRQTAQGGGLRTVSTATQGTGAATPPKPLWIIGGNGKPEVILVRSGTTDGSNTEIIPLREGALAEGTQIILRERVK
jgi:hypothetical protein